jgi:hypothetical protein
LTRLPGSQPPELFEARGVAVTKAPAPVIKPPVPAADSGFSEEIAEILDDLARRIRESRQAAQQAGAAVLHHSLDAGDALNAAQARVSTGWKRWLKNNCFLSVRTALVYQQLARHRDEIEAAIGQAGELSMRAALRLITKPTEEPPEPVGKDADEGENAGKGAELSLLGKLLMTTPAREVAVEFEKQGDVPWLLERLPAPWVPALTGRVARLPQVHDEPFLKASEMLRGALSSIKVASDPITTPAVAASHEKVALAALRQLNVVLAGAGIDEITVIRQHAKEKRCAEGKRRKGKKRRRAA